ncbi:MAG: hypothetical protein ACK5MT_05900 [Actinomycetales bacterium]
MSTDSPVMLKFEQSTEQVTGSIKRVVGFVRVRHLAGLITSVNLESNPRSSKTGGITEAILESLDRTPETFPSKTKGILVGCSSYRARERQRYELTFTEPILEGILDGGHNALAVGLFILRGAGVSDRVTSRIKLWADFKDVWTEQLEIIEQAVVSRDLPEFDILMPVELLVPTEPEDTAVVDDFSASLLDICAARNNNAQLRAETKANQSGYFETLKEVLPAGIADAVEWKTNDGGRIKAADIVALSWISLSLLQLPNDEDGRPVEAPVPQNIYRSKGDCVTRFERLMSSPSVTASEDGQYRRTLKSPQVRSALQVTAKLVELHDQIYARFPDAYNANDGKFLRITAVKKMNNSDRKKYTKYIHEEVAIAIPEGFVVPLVYGLQALLEVDATGCVRWRTDPDAFLEEKLNSIVGEHKSVVALLDYDPQKVGKAPEAYRMARIAYEMELLRSRK